MSVRRCCARRSPGGSAPPGGTAQSEDWIANRLDVRLVRQDRLTDEQPIKLIAIIDQHALWKPRWRKSSRSGGGGDNDSCVELAYVDSLAGVRDSKNTAGPVLSFPQPAWFGFLQAHGAREQQD